MRSILFFILLIATGFVSFSAYKLAFSQFSENAIRVSQNRLSLYSATLRSSLERLSHLPKTVSIYPNVVNVLNEGVGHSALNKYLESVNQFSGGAALYVMDINGDTIASSNYNSKESFVGKNYSFRPYFINALKGEEGRVFAVGATTGRPGYFVSWAIRDNKKIIGVAVIKTEFTELLSDWQKADETVLISDKDGIILLASKSNYTYQTISKLSDETLSALTTNKKFGNLAPTQLDFTSNDGEFRDTVEIADSIYHASNREVESTNWKIHYLTPLEPFQTAGAVIGGLIFVLCILAWVIFLYLRARINRKKLESEAKEATRIRKINTKLQNEIDVRIEAESKLVQAQAELIQSSRLAALGTMSAAIVHEVNQPVSAIRTFAASGVLLSKSNRKKELIVVFEQIKNMTERLGTITSDLLVFSRKPIAKPEAVNLNESIDQILKQYSLLFKEKNIKLDLRLKNAPLKVIGSKVRFEQLISNLIKNALDACPEDDAEITIKGYLKDQIITLQFKDNGDGIAQDMVDKVFDPFVTTKKIGKGVGLGLALCYAIVNEAGGKITIQNNLHQGALINVELPQANET